MWLSNAIHCVEFLCNKILPKKIVESEWRILQEWREDHIMNQPCVV